MGVDVDHVLGTLGAHREDVLDELARAQLTELGRAQHLHQEERICVNMCKHLTALTCTRKNVSV